MGVHISKFGFYYFEILLNKEVLSIPLVLSSETMAGSLSDSAQAQWLAQMEAMKSAIASLKLPRNSQATSVDWEEEDSDHDYSSVGGSQDVWDYISDSELDEIAFDSGDLVDGTDGLDEIPYGPSWLSNRCSEVASTKSGADAGAFQDEISHILSSSRTEDQLQGSLTDLIGFDHLDFVTELLSHREEIVAALVPRDQPVGGRLLTKAQRDEALRKQDIKHKTAKLAPAQAKEPEYPHVYKAYNAGNTLSYSGKRYGLPVGSERKDFEKYSEYSIPAGRTGTLGAGRKLVNISEMDGLCRKTFKGYKTLNRMQSLVYPIAYKTSENMLICAPTGAVSTYLPSHYRSRNKTHGNS